jgi:hypothetical protein
LSELPHAVRSSAMRRTVARLTRSRYPSIDGREPDDDDAAPRAAFGRRIARGITQHQATS